jgi:hypothetical protein
MPANRLVPHGFPRFSRVAAHSSGSDLGGLTRRGPLLRSQPRPILVRVARASAASRASRAAASPRLIAATLRAIISGSTAGPLAMPALYHAGQGIGQGARIRGKLSRRAGGCRSLTALSHPPVPPCARTVTDRVHPI